MRVSVFGLGYVGCVTAASLARAGHQVVGVDLNPEKVGMVNAGTSPIVEPGLGELLAAVVGNGHLRATTSSAQAIDATDVALICVGTPSRETGQLDVDAIARAATEVGGALRRSPRPFTLILRSTVLPGTTEAVVAPALRGSAGADAACQVGIVVNPEFMREGSSLHDFATPPFTLVGSDDAETASPVRLLYSDVQAPFVRTTVRNAEMVKYVANTFHALKICFANEIGDVCASRGADAQEVMRIFRMDRKLNISEAYLRPGFAFGGSCLPKDLRALLHAGRADNLSLALLSSLLPSNDGQIRRAIEAVLATRRRRVGVVGLSFKPGTDDLRESPMVTLVEGLIGKGCNVRILDRNVSIARLVGANRRYIEEEIPHIASLMCESVEALISHAQVLVVGTPSEEALAAVSAAGSEIPVVDLTRGALRSEASPELPRATSNAVGVGGAS